MRKSQAMSHPQLVMPGLVPGIHVLAPKSLGPENEKTWMAGTSPAMTKNGSLVPPVIARSTATKQSSLSAARWIASRSLSSGAHSRDPLAPRNDGWS